MPLMPDLECTRVDPGARDVGLSIPNTEPAGAVCRLRTAAWCVSQQVAYDHAFADSTAAVLVLVEKLGIGRETSQMEQGGSPIRNTNGV